MEEVYVVDFLRTPIGKFGKSLKDLPATELGGKVISEILKRNSLQADRINEIIMGNVIQASNGQNPAGQAARNAGLPDTVLKYTVNLVCASGMLAMENAYRKIAMGDADLIIAGGMESMSSSPLLLEPSVRWGVKQLLGKNLEFQDSMLRDGLLDAFTGTHMGKYAEKSGKKYGIDRSEADKFSYESHERARRAWERNETQKETIRMRELSMDEGIRKTTLDELSKIPPAFSPDGILTAGNSSQLSDGASALLLASKSAIERNGLKPAAVIKGFTRASMAPEDFVEAPVPSARDLMKRLSMKPDDFDLIEHNEAFSVASLIVRNELDIDPAKFNVNGGAIALGHPLGNSGSRIVVTLLNALRERHLSKGLATICHGGGGGQSVALEMIQ